jgi:hypothetical protein
MLKWRRKRFNTSISTKTTAIFSNEGMAGFSFFYPLLQVIHNMQQNRYHLNRLPVKIDKG